MSSDCCCTYCRYDFRADWNPETEEWEVNQAGVVSCVTTDDPDFDDNKVWKDGDPTPDWWGAGPAGPTDDCAHTLTYFYQKQCTTGADCPEPPVTPDSPLTEPSLPCLCCDPEMPSSLKLTTSTAPGCYWPVTNLTLNMSGSDCTIYGGSDGDVIYSLYWNSTDGCWYLDIDAGEGGFCSFKIESLTDQCDPTCSGLAMETDCGGLGCKLTIATP